MENRSVFKSTEKDLREVNGEFCRMWGCRSYKIGYPCYWCPVLSDLKRMATAFNVKLQIMDTVAEKKFEKAS